MAATLQCIFFSLDADKEATTSGMPGEVPVSDLAGQGALPSLDSYVSMVRNDKSDRNVQHVVNTILAGRFGGMQWQEVKKSSDYKDFSKR